MKRITKFNFENVPQELKKKPQWVLWKLGKKKGAKKATKPPYSVHTGKKADKTNAEDLGTFEQCLNEFQNDGAHWDGIGYSFNAENRIVGIDLDHCIIDGKLSKDAQYWVDRFDSYTEISPSGDGLHIFVKGKIPGERHKKGDYEIYEDAAYFTMTGNCPNGEVKPIREAQDAIDEYYNTVFGSKKVETEPEPGEPVIEFGSVPDDAESDTGEGGYQPTDNEVLDKAFNAKNGATIKALFDGSNEGYIGKEGLPDTSAGDAALICLLKFYTQDPAQLERLFSQSARATQPCRDGTIKWERGDYRKKTIDNAISENKYDWTTPTGEKTYRKVGGEKTGKAGGKSTKKLLTREYIEIYANAGYKFSFNEMVGEVYVNDARLEDEQKDIILCSLWDYCTSKKLSAKKDHALAAITVAAKRNSFHPIKQYIDALAWDGHDYIKDLCSYIKSDGLFPRWFEVWLCGSIDKVHNLGFNPALVLDGPQGIGKSRLATHLCPVQDLFHAGQIRADDKDCRLRLTSTWVWEIEELGATTKRQDVEALKAFISLVQVKDRKAYGHFDVIRPAVTSFIGTVNGQEGFLTDLTGNRRFITTTIEKIDFAYSAIPVTQIWAQAKEIWKKGEWQLTKDESEMRDAKNDTALAPLPIATVLEANINITEDENNFVPSLDVLKILEDAGIQVGKNTEMEASLFLTKWGAVPHQKRWAKKYGKQVRGFTKAVVNEELKAKEGDKDIRQF